MASLTAREAAEWEAFYQVDPWGDQRSDMRNAMLCAMWSKGGSVEDFMPWSDDQPNEEQSSELLKMKIAQQFGAGMR